MNLKQKIAAGQLTIGSWITIGHPTVAEIMAKAGFDWLVIDMEHSALSIAQCQELIRVIDLCGVPPLVRVGENQPLLIKQAMDAGAHGVIVPMVNSSQDAQQAVMSVKYPPVGKRGVGLARAQGYGASFQEYKKWQEKETIVIVQIEHIQAVENCFEILSVDGVDAFLIGPYDLSASMGIPGEFSDARVSAALQKVKDDSSRSNRKVVAGYHVVSSNPGLVEEKIKEGYKFISFGVDFLFLGDNSRSGLRALDVLRKKH